MSALQPPHINTTQDPTSAADFSESDDHFSSASEGGGGNGIGSPRQKANRLSTPSTPITRVERVDSQPAYGEVPGTAAYAMRTQDAVPDEIEVVPDGQHSRNRSRANSVRPSTPGGTPIPRTVVEKVDDRPAYGEVEGTLARDMRMADALPDEVRRVTEPRKNENGDVVAEGSRDDESILDEKQRQAWFRSMWEGRGEQQQQTQTERGEGEEGSGDDFNEGDEDDFGDFDEAAEEEQPTPLAEHPPPSSSQTRPMTDVFAGLPPLSLSNLSPKATLEALTPYVTAIIPPTRQLSESATTQQPTTPFLSDRSLALWQQLVSPPPLQPPNWTRSRIRRLFLVSLGVPVDLDEILPPSKQKRLILPNIHLPRSSTTAAGDGVERLRNGGEANDSSTSLDSKTGQPKSRRRKKGLQGPPNFDLNAASLMCGTTEAALRGMGDVDLKEHVERLKALNGRASEVLEFWLLRKDEAVKEKEALEGVIENLVGFVKGRRGK